MDYGLTGLGSAKAINQLSLGLPDFNNSSDMLWGDKAVNNFSGMDGYTGDTNAPASGWGSPGMGQGISLGLGALQGLGGLANAYLGMKNYGLAKDTLASNKQQYWNNFTSQARLTNAQLRDRQRTRVASGNPGMQDVESYMAQNGIDEKGYK